MTILLVDDAASVREVLRLALESDGYRVIEAADCREGVRQFRVQRPAVTIVDIVMPDKDGIETVHEILALDPAAVIITMSDRDDYQEVAKMIGARRGFLKPGGAQGLLGEVRAALVGPHSPHILLIRPPVPNDTSFQELLSWQGYRITLVSTWDEARPLLRDSSWDLGILGSLDPVDKGKDFLKEVLEARGSRRIIVMTAWLTTYRGLAEELVAMGVHRVFSKVEDIDELIAGIRQALECRGGA